MSKNLLGIGCFLSISASFVLLLSACRIKQDKSPILDFRQLYPNGTVWKIGKMNSDSVIVDTLKIYSNEGILREVRVYDSTGVLNGFSYLFDKTGKKDYMLFLKNGKPFGYSYTFYGNGQIKTKNYHLGNQVGNAYHYDVNGKVDTFAFFGFNHDGLIEKHYLNGRLVKQYYKSYFIDTILTSSSKDSLKLGFIVARPPHEQVKLTIYKLDRKEKSYDSIPNISSDLFDSVKINLKDSVRKLKLVCRRYDSALNQTTIEEGVITVEKRK